MKNIYVLLLCCLVFSLKAQKPKRIEVLFLGDKGHHRPIERVPQLMAALGAKGVNFTYTENMNDINEQYLKYFDAILIYANIDVLKPENETAMLNFVAGGKALIPVHCATFCFRNSEKYTELSGGQFWRHTMDSITIVHDQPNHPILKGIKPFTVYDETYLHSKIAADINVLAHRDIKADQFKDKPGQKTEPYVWTKNYGKGKVFYTALGHDERTWSNAGFQELMYNGILWAINDEAKAAHKALNPKPFEYRPANLPNYEQRPGIQMQQLALSPDESMKHIQVPVEFNLELFAAEPDVQHPIAMTWDEKGRLFVLITKDYPNERKPEGGTDYILLCEDTNADGKADKFIKFAEKLSIPTGLVFANGGLIVSQAPDMLFLKDTDGDNKADERKVLFSGFGTFDTHAGPSNLHYGFDNWVWGCVGYSGFKGKVANSDSLKFGQAFFRFKPDGSEMEWMTSTSNNTWGFGFNEAGDVFGSTANNSHGWYMPIPNRFYNSKNGVDNGSRSTDTHRDMKPITEKVRQVDAFGGFTAAAGHNFYTARAFPEKYWNKIAFVAEPTGHVLHQNNMVKNGTDYSDKESFNLMAGADEWFSPVFAEVGPDGAVWVADWYSYIIQHNPVPKTFKNGGGNAYETDLRDFTHGRIYRVSAKNPLTVSNIKLDRNDPNSLINALSSDNMFWRLQAQRLLVERGKLDVVDKLKALIKSSKPDASGVNVSAIHALWTLRGINGLDLETIEEGLQNSNAEVRKNTLQLMYEKPKTTELILKYNLLNDPEPLVVLNALLLMSKSPLNAEAEKAFFDKLKIEKNVNDRWLPDAYACVLNANNGLLMKKLLNMPEEIASKSNMSHDQHKMEMQKVEKSAIAVNGVDLIITDIKIDPKNPAVRDRINVSIEVKNQGNEDFKSDILIPIDVNFEGMGLKIGQFSNNFKDGIKAGEIVSIVKNLNGPWVGNLSFYTDMAGEYSLRAQMDKNNQLKEVNKSNNNFTKKLSFSAPTSIQNYALEKAVKSFSSISEPSALITLLRNAKSTQQDLLIKGINDGWNHKLKNIVLKPDDKDFVNQLYAKNNNEKLLKLLQSWKAIDVSASTINYKTIRIKTVREAMKYDLSNFTVKAGEQIEIILENPDAMQHNLVIVKPKSMEKVGKAADKMMLDDKAMEKNYVPSLTEVLFATPLINPDQTYSLKFTVPNTPGIYPYVCTFPGHWRLMNGNMKVIK